MKTQKINDVNSLISGDISQDLLATKRELIAKRMAKSAKIDGFRKGKVPPHIIKARYGEQVEQDARQEAVNELLDSGLKELGIANKELLTRPHVVKFEEKDGLINVEIKVSQRPKFSVDGVEKFVPNVILPNIEEAQVLERIKDIAKARALPLEITQDRALEKGDIAKIDFEGFLDGRAFDGGKAEGYNLVIGSAQFIPGFEDALIGMKKGEEKTIDVTFPSDYQASNLAGKNVQFKVKLHAILEKVIGEVDEDMAKSILGAEGSLEMLKGDVSSQLLQEEKMKLYNTGLKNDLVDALIKNISFDLPDIIVEQEMDLLFRNAINGMSKEEFDKIKDDENALKEKRDSFKDNALRNVQATFIIDALAKKYNIVVSDEEVRQTLYYEAMMMGKDGRVMLEQYQQSGLLPNVKMAMMEDRVLTYLLDLVGEKDANNANKDSKGE